MGRSVPLDYYHHHEIHHLIHQNHPVLTLTILITTMAATISMIMALCIRRKQSKPTPSPSDDDIKPPSSLDDENDTKPPTNEDSEDGSQQPPKELLPLPPAMMMTSSNPPTKLHLHHSRSSSNLTRATSSVRKMVKKSMSTRKVETSVSMKMPMSISVMDHEEKIIKKGKLKHEDSIWTKTIILGEKCKVSEEDEDAIIYDKDGNKIPAYHKRAYSTLSRQNSNPNVDRSSFLNVVGLEKEIVNKDSDVKEGHRMSVS